MLSEGLSVFLCVCHCVVFYQLHRQQFFVRHVVGKLCGQPIFQLEAALVRIFVWEQERGEEGESDLG